MSLNIVTAPTGLHFDDWQDVLHDIEDGATLGSFVRDFLDPDEEWFLRMEAATRGTRVLPVDSEDLFTDPRPETIKMAKGVGNWYSPKAVVVVQQLKGGRKKKLAEWHGMPNYIRVRPFSETLKSLKFIRNIMEPSGVAPEQIYCTAFEKSWMETDASSEELLRAEMDKIGGTPVYITFTHDTADRLFKATGIGSKIIGLPMFWTKTHAIEWDEFRGRLKEAIGV